MRYTTDGEEFTRIHPLSCGLGYAFLIETNQGLLLIDSGSPGHEQKALERMRKLGRADLKLIWITHAHYDHYGSAAALRKLTGALVGIHPADSDSLIYGQSLTGSAHRYGVILPMLLKMAMVLKPLPKIQPDLILGDGSTLEQYGLDAYILHTPGHTPGHTCVILEGGIAFAGDLISSLPRPGLQRLLATNWSQLNESLAKLKSARPAWIYCGHRRNPIPGSELHKM